MLGGGMNGSGGPDVCGDCIILYIKQDNSNKLQMLRKAKVLGFYCSPEARPRAFGHQNVARGDIGVRGRISGCHGARL